MPNQHRPSRTTTRYGIPVTGDDSPADWVTAWGATADAADAAIYGAVAGVGTTVSNALAQLAAGRTPNPAVEARVIGGRLAQLVETRPDGTKNTSTLTYSGDLLTVLTQNNPARTFTFTYSGTALTGWSVA